MNKVVYVPAFFVPVGENQKACHIDGKRLANDLAKIVSDLNNEGYEVVSVTPVTSGTYAFNSSYKEASYSSYQNYNLGGYGYGYGFGYSYTSGLIVTAKAGGLDEIIRQNTEMLEVLKQLTYQQTSYKVKEKVDNKLEEKCEKFEHGYSSFRYMALANLSDAFYAAKILGKLSKVVNIKELLEGELSKTKNQKLMSKSYIKNSDPSPMKVEKIMDKLSEMTKKSFNLEIRRLIEYKEQMWLRQEREIGVDIKWKFYRDKHPTD